MRGGIQLRTERAGFVPLDGVFDIAPAIEPGRWNSPGVFIELGGTTDDPFAAALRIGHRARDRRSRGFDRGRSTRQGDVRSRWSAAGTPSLRETSAARDERERFCSRSWRRRVQRREAVRRKRQKQWASRVAQRLIRGLRNGISAFRGAWGRGRQSCRWT